MENSIAPNSNDPVDATPSWSGYCYQGKVAMLHAINLLNELLESGEALDPFSLEIEWVEDFAILRGEEYLSIHQVKAKRDENVGVYRIAIANLLSRLLQNITPKDLIPIADIAWKNYEQVYQEAEIGYVQIVFDKLRTAGFLTGDGKLSHVRQFERTCLNGLNFPTKLCQAIEQHILNSNDGKVLTQKELISIRRTHLPRRRKNEFKSSYTQRMRQNLMDQGKISPIGSYLADTISTESWLESIPYIEKSDFIGLYNEVWNRIRDSQVNLEKTTAVLHTLSPVREILSGNFDFLPDGFQESLDRFRQDEGDCVTQDQIDDQIKHAICNYYQTLDSPGYKLEALYLHAAFLALCGTIDSHVASRHVWRQNHPGQQTPSDVRRIPFAKFKEVLDMDFQEWSDSRWARLLRNVFEHALEDYLESEHRRDSLGQFLSPEQIAEQNERLIEYLDNSVLEQYREIRFLDFCQLINPDRNISDSDEERISALNKTGLENVFFRFFASIEQSFSYSGPMILKANDSVILPSLIVDDNERRVALRVWDDFCVPEIGYEIEELVTQFIDIEDLEAFVRKIKDVGDEGDDDQVHRNDTHLMKRKPTRIVSIKNAIDVLTT